MRKISYVDLAYLVSCIMMVVMTNKKGEVEEEYRKTMA
jgi:hypothetical protein